MRFASAPDNMNMAFRVLAENGAQVWGWQTAPMIGQPFEAWADIKTPGVYYLEVRDGSNDARSKDSYDLHVGLDSTADPAEPNDRRDTATPLAFGQPVTASILPLGEADFNRIQAPRQGELRLHFTEAPANLNMAFRVLGENGAQVWGWQAAPSNGAAFEAIAEIGSPGTYFVEVRDGSNDARSSGAYVLIATLN